MTDDEQRMEQSIGWLMQRARVILADTIREQPQPRHEIHFHFAGATIETAYLHNSNMVAVRRATNQISDFDCRFQPSPDFMRAFQEYCAVKEKDLQLQRLQRANQNLEEMIANQGRSLLR